MNAKPKILIIDDDKDLCESILDIVELESYSVDTSHTAADGLKKIENNFYNIVLLDMELPESDGLTVLGKIKEVSTDTEVIIFTAYAEMDTVIAAMDKDAFSFLPKPFEIPYILTTIKRALKKQQLLHENRILYQKTIDEEREWEDTFDSISDLVSIHDKNLKIIRCNKAVKEKLNIEYRDIIGKKCHEAFYGNIDLGLECPFVRCMETMQPESTEEECLGGTFIMSCYPRFDKTGQFNGVVHIARDITARKQVEHAMNTLVATATKNEGEEFFEQVVSGLCDWLNVDCVILSQLVDENNQTALAMKRDGQLVKNYSYELQGTPCGNILKKGFCHYPEGIIDLFPDDVELAQWKAEGYVGLSLKDKYGNCIGTLCALSHHRLELPPGAENVFNIISARASVEIERMKAEKRATSLASVVENSLNETYIYKADTLKFLQANKGARINLGYSMDTLRKLTPLHIKPKLTQESFEELVEPLRSGEKDFIVFETVHQRKDGSLYNVEVHLQLTIYESVSAFLAITLDITERKQRELTLNKTENELLKSNQKFRAIFDNTFQSIGLLKPDGTLIESNKGSLEYANIKYSDVINKPYWETAWWSHSAPLQRLLQKSIKHASQGNFVRFHATHIKKNGSQAYVDISLTPVKDKEGNVIFIITEGRDITELKIVEETVHKLSQAIQQSNVIVVITDIEGNIEYVNPKFCKSTGYEYSEIMGQNPRMLKSGETSDEIYRELWKTITSGNEWRGEFHNKKKSGEFYWENASISPICDKDGKIINFLGIKEDITDKKLAEQALIESEGKSRIISDAANDGIIMIDNDGLVSYWNNAAEKIFGYSNKEAIGEKVVNLIVPDKYRQAHLQGFSKYQNTGVGPIIGKTVEYTAIRKNGDEFPIEHSISAVNIKGKWHAVGILRDISERLKTEEQLRISYKMASLGRLTAGVFHELLNPVNIISSHVQLLLMEAEKGSKTEEDLCSIQEEISRIVKISDNLLRFSRKGGTESDNIKINDLLESTISLLEPDMKLENIVIFRKFDEGLQQITASKDQLRQVFLNLLTNARDAMPDGGTITVSTENITGEEATFIRVKISDTGCGVEKSQIHKIFDPFFTTKREGKGTGLGLSTSYGIIEDHGGAMSAESEVGKGTTFIIDLPI